jgi:LPXTG-motif cell wall-anchored protein
VSHPKVFSALAIASLASGALLLSAALPAAATPGLTASGTGTVMSQLLAFSVPGGSQPEGVVIVAGITYVPNPLTHSVAKFDALGLYLGDIPLPGPSPYPSSIVASPDGSHLFVTDINGVGTVDSIDIATVTVTPFPVATAPGQITLSPDGSTFYVVSNSDGLVHAYATSDGHAVGSAFPDGRYATSNRVMVSPDGTKVYQTMRDPAGAFTTGGIRILNAAGLVEIGHTDLLNADGLAESADGSKIWVGSTDAAFQSVVAEFDADGTFTGRSVAVGSGPHSLIVSADGKWIYVAGSSGNTLDVIDTSDFSDFRDTVTPLVIGSTQLALSADGLRLYGANRNSGMVGVVSIAKLTLTSPASVTPATGATTFSAQITDGTSPIADYTTNTVKFDVLDSSNAVVATETVAPNSSGHASVSLDLSNLAIGTYSVRATLDPIAGSVVVTAAGLSVSAVALAATGTQPVVPTLIGVLLLLVGAASLVARRRRTV